MTYEFESYSDTHMVLGVFLGTALCMLAVFGAIILIDAVPILKSYDDYVIISISILTLVILWVLTKNYLVQKSKITLKNDLLIFQRKSNRKELRISDIESYKYKLVQGVRLVIWTRYNEKIVIHANDYFCDHGELEVFCSDFDKYIDTLNSKIDKPSPNFAKRDPLKAAVHVEDKSGNPDSEKLEVKNPLNFKPYLKNQAASKETHNQIPKRKRSFYERKYALPFLLVFSVLTVVFVIYVIVDDGDLPAALIVSAAGLSAMWAGYFNHRKK